MQNKRDTGSEEHRQVFASIVRPSLLGITLGNMTHCSGPGTLIPVDF